jgi:Ca2+/H+ antiporter
MCKKICTKTVSSTIGLTVPAILVIGLITGQPGFLGLAAASIVLLEVTLVLCTITFFATAHNHSGGCGASSAVLRLHRFDF